MRCDLRTGLLLCLAALSGCAQLRRLSGDPPDLAPAADLATAPSDDLALAPGGDLAAAPATHVVLVAPNGSLVFSPDTLTIRAGDSVRWEFQSTHHTVTSVNGTFCSPDDTNCSAGTTSNAGEVYLHLFPARGTFPYFCTPHLTDGMEGTIIVE